MEQNRGLTDLIYEYYESRILFGIYRYGERLSSVPQICAAFRLGRNTVLSALDKLEKNGYIETEERKTARVIYQGRSIPGKCRKIFCTAQGGNH